jgi:glucose-1-phosphate thymidylyltransferase
LTHKDSNNRFVTPHRPAIIGDHITIRKTEIENNVVMEGTHIDCSRRITDSLIGRKVSILNHEHNVPKGHKLILGDQSIVTL